MASGAGIAQAALAVAARAGEAELHRARHLLDVAGAIALRANRRCAAHRAAAVASLADFLARDVEPDLRPADGLPEIDVEAVFEIRAFFRSAIRPFFAAVAEKLAENVAKSARAGPATGLRPAGVD